MSSPGTAPQDDPARHRWARLEGKPYPLGQTWVDSQAAYNFAVYSENAEQVVLLLFSEADLGAPAYEIPLDPFRNKSTRVWHARVKAADVPTASYYAYRVTGPDGAFHRFDPDKLAVDPFARCVWFPSQFSRPAASAPGSNMGEDPWPGSVRTIRRSIASRSRGSGMKPTSSSTKCMCGGSPRRLPPAWRPICAAPSRASPSGSRISRTSA